MRCPDVNVLLYAHRRDHRHHDWYRQWMEDLANGSEPFAISSLAAIALIRIVTQPSFPGGPTPVPLVVAEIENLLRVPTCRWILPGPRHWELVSRLVRETGATGKHVGDAQHAAVAIENGCAWVTRDTDFERYRYHGLRLEILAPE